MKKAFVANVACRNPLRQARMILIKTGATNKSHSLLSRKRL